MPIKRGTPEGFERLTGSRGSVYIGPAPVRRKPSQEKETPPTQSGEDRDDDKARR